jgi:hypothetical protein
MVAGSLGLLVIPEQLKSLFEVVGPQGIDQLLPDRVTTMLVTPRSFAARISIRHS